MVTFIVNLGHYMVRDFCYWLIFLIIDYLHYLFFIYSWSMFDHKLSNRPPYWYNHVLQLNSGLNANTIHQAFAKHLLGVDWDYHHNFSYVNQTSFLLNYLSDVVQGATSYSDWINGNLYEQTKEEFGICSFPGMYLDFMLHYFMWKVDSLSFQNHCVDDL